MTGEEGRQTLSHAAGILYPGRCVASARTKGSTLGNHESSSSCRSPQMGSSSDSPPRQQGPAGRCNASSRVNDHRRQFLAEEGVRVGHVLVEGTGRA